MFLAATRHEFSSSASLTKVQFQLTTITMLRPTGRSHSALSLPVCLLLLQSVHMSVTYKMCSRLPLLISGVGNFADKRHREGPKNFRNRQELHRFIYGTAPNRCGEIKTRLALCLKHGRSRRGRGRCDATVTVFVHHFQKKSYAELVWCSVTYCDILFTIISQRKSYKQLLGP